MFEIDGASNNGVEQVRELRETCKYAPASSRFKIYIIDEVHMLSTAAFNALLKTLEEPPEHVKFMFATTDPEKVLPTILSRCQRFDLRRIPAALIAKHLTHIAELEKVKIDPAALYAIARGAEGAMRDAESALDQLISFCGEKIEEADVLSMFGLTAQGQLLELSRAVLAGEVERALRQLNDLANHGKDLGRLLSDLLNHFRNLLIFQVSRRRPEHAGGFRGRSRGAEGAIPDGRRGGPDAHHGSPGRGGDAAARRGFEEDSGRSGPAQSHRSPQRGEHRFAAQAAPEFARRKGRRSRWRPRARGGGQPEACASSGRLRRLRPRRHALPCRRARRRSRAAGWHELRRAPAGDLAELWARLLEAVGRASPFTRTYLLEAHPVSFQKNVFTIGFDPEFEDHLGLVDNARNHTLLQTKLLELGHPNAQIKFIKAEAPAEPRGRAGGTGSTARARAAPTLPPKPPAPAKPAAAPAAPVKEKLAAVPFSKDDFKNDPLIQKALGDLQGPDRRGPRLTLSIRHQPSTLNPYLLKQCPALANS